MFGSIKSTAQRLQRDERGSVAIMFGLTVIILCLCGGLAIDVGIATHTKNKVAAAIDAATLAAAKAMREQNLSVADTEKVARDYFDANMGGVSNTYGTVSNFVVRVDQRNGSVEIDVDMEVKTYFGALAGIQTFNVPATSVALIAGKDIEVGVQLDVTGSMCDDGPRPPCSTGPKIGALKAAVIDLINTVVPDTPGAQRVRVGLAPFAAGVNSGRFANAVNGNRGGANACVYERINAAAQTSDDAPTGTSALKIRGDLPGSSICPSEPVTELLGDAAGDKAKLRASVDRLRAENSTAGHLGSAWASYLLSPDWNSVWNLSAPVAPYNDGKTLKFAILMTDGVYNTVGGINSLANRTISSNFAKDTCAEMKRNGIAIYTIGFDVKEPLAHDVLRNCATDSSMYYRPQTGGELQAVFNEIAQDIVSLRLTK